jgi:hypothetical protein
VCLYAPCHFTIWPILSIFTQFLSVSDGKRDQRNFIIFNFMQSVLVTWWTHTWHGNITSLNVGSWNDVWLVGITVTEACCRGVLSGNVGSNSGIHVRSFSRVSLVPPRKFYDCISISPPSLPSISFAVFQFFVHLSSCLPASRNPATDSVETAHITQRRTSFINVTVIQKL